MLPSTITPHPTYLLGKGTGLMAFYNRKIYSNTSILGTINQCLYLLRLLPNSLLALRFEEQSSIWRNFQEYAIIHRTIPLDHMTRAASMRLV